MFIDDTGHKWKYKITKIAKIQEFTSPILLSSNNWLVRDVGIEVSYNIVPIISEYTTLYKSLKEITTENYKLDTSKSHPLEIYNKYGNYVSIQGNRLTLNKTNIFDSWTTSEIKHTINSNLFITKNSVYFVYDEAIFREEQLNKLLEE